MKAVPGIRCHVTAAWIAAFLVAVPLIVIVGSPQRENWGAEPELHRGRVAQGFGFGEESEEAFFVRLVEDLKKLDRDWHIVRVKSDSDDFVAEVRRRGGEVVSDLDAWRIALPEGASVAWIFEAAAASGTQIRHIRKAEDTLEDIFLRATGHAA